jgi:hypothetical protein
MKKIIALTVFSLLVSGQAFALNTITMNSDLTATAAKSGLTLYGDKTTATATTATLIGKTSTGVSVGVMVGAGGYAMITQHKSGIKAFATSFNSTSVFYKDATAGTAVLTVPTATDSTDFASWSSM